MVPAIEDFIIMLEEIMYACEIIRKLLRNIYLVNTHSASIMKRSFYQVVCGIVGRLIINMIRTQSLPSCKPLGGIRHKSLY